MIREVRVVNHLNDELSIKLTESEPTHGLIIQSINGLGPSKAILGTSYYASIDGVDVSNIRMDSRQITMNLLFVPCPDVEQARRNTYKYFPIKRTVTLYFYTDYGLRYISGIVEGNEPDVFNQQSMTMITITCPDPYFRTDDGNTKNMDILDLIDTQSFEFVYENDSVAHEAEVKELIGSDVDPYEFAENVTKNGAVYKDVDAEAQIELARALNATEFGLTSDYKKYLTENPPSTVQFRIPNFTVYNPGIPTDGIDFEILIEDSADAINGVLSYFTSDSKDILFKLVNTTTDEKMYLSFKKMLRLLYWPKTSTGKFPTPSSSDVTVEFRIVFSTRSRKKAITLEYLEKKYHSSYTYTSGNMTTYYPEYWEYLTDKSVNVMPALIVGSNFIHLEQGDNSLFVDLVQYTYQSSKEWEIGSSIYNYTGAYPYYRKFFVKPNILTMSFDPIFEGV